MKKKLLPLLLLLLSAALAMTTVACAPQSYPFIHETGEISGVEIGYISNGTPGEFTARKVLSEEDVPLFLRDFQTIEFHTYIAGDPMSLSGDAIRIVYQNGDCEVICPHWSEAYRDGRKLSKAINCNSGEDAFFALIERYGR